MRSLTPLQRAVVTTTAVLAWGGFWIGAALAQPNVLTIQHEPATRAIRPHSSPTSAQEPRPVFADTPTTPEPYRRSQRLTVARTTPTETLRTPAKFQETHTEAPLSETPAEPEPQRPDCYDAVTGETWPMTRNAVSGEWECGPNPNPRPAGPAVVAEVQEVAEHG